MLPCQEGLISPQVQKISPPPLHAISQTALAAALCVAKAAACRWVAELELDDERASKSLEMSICTRCRAALRSILYNTCLWTTVWCEQD